MTVDWDLIRGFEGESKLVGYVPDVAGSQSGVTIGTGCDLGQRDDASLKALGIDEELIEKLLPYLGLRRFAAVAFLEKHPLTITQEESDALDAAIHNATLADLRSNYDAATRPSAFDSVPDAAQTIMTSVALQYGTELARRTPRFWAAVVAGDWQVVVAELRDFGDRYPKRRGQEAAYLEQCLGGAVPVDAAPTANLIANAPRDGAAPDRV